MQIASGPEQDQSSSAERCGRSHLGKVVLASCAGNTNKNDVFFKIAFVQGFVDKPGSNAMYFSHHVLN